MTYENKPPEIDGKYDQMKRNIFIIILILLILGIIGFMVYDLFYPDLRHQNPYKLEIDDTLQIDEDLVAYTEIKQIEPGIKSLNSISIDASDRVIIAGSEVVVYDQEWNQLSRFQPTDTIYGLAVGPDGKLYLGINNLIEVRDYKGNLINSWYLANKDALVNGMAATDHYVYIADADARLVYQYDTKGQYINDLGRGDAEKGIPGIIIRSSFFDVSIGRNDEVWIANPGRFSLQAFNANGDFISSWGEQSNAIEGFCGCCNPSNFALLANGDFVTGEKSIPRVKIYSPDGKFKSVVATPQQFDEGTKGLDLAVDSGDRIYVLDPARKQIRIFEKNK